MVLTNAQTTAFFVNAAQMAIPQETYDHLATEGIEQVTDLGEFDKQDIDQIAKNLRNQADGAALSFGAKSHKRMIVACEIVRYYETVGRPLTASNIAWTHVMRNFDIQWKALKEKKKEGEPTTPKISKGLNIMKWSEAFSDYLYRCIGSRNIPLAYVTRQEATPSATLPTLAPNMPHSEEAGSIEQELINRASHSHSLFRDDNAAVYYRLEEATRSTQYAASIKPFQRRKDGEVPTLP